MCVCGGGGGGGIGKTLNSALIKLTKLKSTVMCLMGSGIEYLKVHITFIQANKGTTSVQPVLSKHPREEPKLFS